MPKEDERGVWQRAMGDAGPYIGLGLQLGLTVAFYTLVGLGLDLWLDTAPLFLLIGGGVGIAVMFLVLVRAAQDLNKKADASRRAAADRRAATEEANEQPNNAGTSPSQRL